ncbi:hypothetical protein [uncultured Brachyspira sp.]|uniref:hypothetical protein n=1 Tax=uncultured Brachyspira sp. TaxID=221953 RepID=UPI003207C0B0
MLLFLKKSRDIVILVNLVHSMIEINKKLNNERNPDVVTILRWQVEVIDGGDLQVGLAKARRWSGLYGLSDNEISIIENGNLI